MEKIYLRPMNLDNAIARIGRVEVDLLHRMRGNVVDGIDMEFKSSSLKCPVDTVKDIPQGGKWHRIHCQSPGTGVRSPTMATLEGRKIPRSSIERRVV